MSAREAKRTEILLPIRTVLIVVAAAGLVAAFRSIGDVFLVVFLGIFLALVFEYPVRFLMAKTRLSRGPRGDAHGARRRDRGARARAASARAARRQRARFPQGPAAARRPAAGVGRALVARTRAPAGTSRRARSRSRPRCPTRSRPCSGSRALLRRVPRLLHDHLHLHLPADRHRSAQAGARKRVDAGRGHPLAQRLGAGDGVDLALGDRRGRDRGHRRDDAGRDGVAPRVELRRRARA